MAWHDTPYARAERKKSAAHRRVNVERDALDDALDGCEVDYVVPPGVGEQRRAVRVSSGTPTTTRRPR